MADLDEMAQCCLAMIIAVVRTPKRPISEPGQQPRKRLGPLDRAERLHHWRGRNRKVASGAFAGDNLFSQLIDDLEQGCELCIPTSMQGRQFGNLSAAIRLPGSCSMVVDPRPHVGLGEESEGRGVNQELEIGSLRTPATSAI